MVLVVVAIIVVLAIVALICMASFFKRKREAALISSLDDVMREIEVALARQDALLDFDTGYLMKKDWDEALAASLSVLNKLKQIPGEIRRAHPRCADIARFENQHTNKDLRDSRNEQFKVIELEACEPLFSDIDGKSLDSQQRDAVVTDEYSNLVIAGAGSGKTLTVVGKIKYLVERRGVAPADILVTSFTRKSVGELADRIERAGIEGVSAKTFHKIGLEQLGKVGIANENELKNCVFRYLKKGIHEHPDQMSAYIEFYGCYKHMPKDRSEYKNDGERMESLKAEDLTTLKGQLDTLAGERVKSLEELMIANFLFMHGVSYEYERNYDGKYETEGRAYQPDFYLPDYDIWLEHFGINENGRCPWIETPFEEKKYIEGMTWKRQIHAANGTHLIESYSYWNKDHDLLNKLETLLKDNGVSLEIDPERLASIYRELSQDDKYLRSIATLVSTFLSLAKANNISMAEAADQGRVKYKGDGFMWHRFELFMAFAEPIMALYQQTLSNKRQIDFDDMINMAAAKISEEGIDEKYRYIIVDEYQDISMSRFELIKAIRDVCGAKLMCVGDDWQSIYRFAGSDVSLFTDFGKYVGFHETLKIEHTYRNSQELVDIASSFIERNSAQIHKQMVSSKHADFPVVINYGSSMAEGLEKSFDSILTAKDDVGSILVLGRHNFDIETAYPEFKGQDKWANGCISLKRDHKTGDVAISYKGYNRITFMSVHRAKGLEADNVVVLNLTNGRYGFPNRIEDDPILQVLLGGDEFFEFSEERRLFYVALTRTKNTSYLVAGSLEGGSGPSPFVEELRNSSSDHIDISQTEDQDLLQPVLCPRCGTGRLVIRRNSQTDKSFLGCTNYPFCEKSYARTEILEDRLRCPSCDGWMVRRRRNSDGNPFFGCSNFPDCKATIDADDNFTPMPSQRSAVTYAYVSTQRSYGGHNRTSSSGKKSYSKQRNSASTDKKNPKASSMRCPRCGAPLKLLKNRKDGSEFYGCTRYPSCNYTRNK